KRDIMAALRRIRALSPALIVCKRGPMGCALFAGVIPETLDQGLRGPGFPVEVYNVLGAGDAFLSGFLRGWLRDQALETCATWATACGAFAVSRLLCSPESPTWEELNFFLEHGSPHRALRRDARINHLHWATTRRAVPEHLMVLAMDHRAQFEAMAEAAAVGSERIGPFKELAVKAAARVAAGRSGFGLLLDDTYGMRALNEAARHHLWIARPVELPASRPLDFEGQGDLGSRLVEWPVTHTVKCLCLFHPDDPEALKQAQERELNRLHDACRRLRRELLIELIAGKHGSLDDMTLAVVLRRLYDCGIKPDWWKLEPQTSPSAWRNITEAIEDNDPHCRGILLLGGGTSQAELKKAFHAAASSGKVKGFAVGRSIFAETAEAWFRGEIGDEDAVATMADRFSDLVEAWQEAAGGPQAASAMSGTLAR
ncbi:MAG: PfkB family carbohydrate kinase, partial [Kiloniellales bacterium]